MPSLSLAEIKKYDYRADLLVDKVFEKNKKKCYFNTDNGLFCASSIKIAGKQFKKYDKSLADIIRNMEKGKKLEVVGKYKGKNASKTLSVSKLEKTEEFGGMPAGGKRVNKGNKFEKDFTNDVADILNGVEPSHGYKGPAEAIVDKVSAIQKSPADSVKQVGGTNVSRPLRESAGSPFIAPNNHRQHGAKLTDVNIHHANSSVSHLSLKFGSTLTFMNSGVAGFLSQDEIKSGMIKNKLGLALLETFGIDIPKFCGIFNNYGTKIEDHAVDVTKHVNKSNLKSFLKTAIGSNYYMVHGQEGGSVDFWYMDPKDINSYATINSTITAYYGGMRGDGKRLDVTFENSYFEFKLNIRNKQGGIYPSHVMLDYKSLKGIKKTTFK